MQQRQGGPEFELELAGSDVAKGGFLFHYNRPYCDIYMEVSEGYGRRGLARSLSRNSNAKLTPWAQSPVPVAIRRNGVAPNAPTRRFRSIRTHIQRNARPSVKLLP